MKEKGCSFYFILSPQRILVEYYLIQNNQKDCEGIFKKIIESFNVEKVYCKSFDSLLLKCSLKNALSHRIIGTLFRDFVETESDAIDEFDIRKAMEEDIPVLLQYTDELYESKDELYKMVRAGNIYMYHLQNHLIGCGFLTKTINNRDFYDIGMSVNSPFRKKGYGTRIIANLKVYCLNNDMTPICGCAVDNIASKKTLEKNGFISKHDLIEFIVK